MKTALLLINLGTPDSPTAKDLRKYLSEFLNDPRVIDINPVGRFLLVNGIIVPFRSPKSAKLYSEIWTSEGSPLMIHTRNLANEVQKVLPNTKVYFAMRYGTPSIKSVMDKIKSGNFKKLIVLPLYPQYSSSTTGSTIERVMEELNTWFTMPEVKVISSFYDFPEFINCWKSIGDSFPVSKYDHVLFSFHGVPERHIRKSDPAGCCLKENCCAEINFNNHQCYRASCFQTARSIASVNQIPESKYTITFQSRLGKDPWIKPYSDETIINLAKSGVKKLLVYSPAFVADCLETIHEIGVEYNHLFKEHGGEKITLVPSLNTHPVWINALKKLVEERS